MFLSRSASNNIIKHALAQAATMGVAFGTGIVLVRELSKTDYAYYSICVSLIAALGLVGEAGVGSVIMSKGGRMSVDALNFFQLMTSAQRYRFLLAIPLAILGGAVTTLVLHMAGATWHLTIVLTAVSMTSVWVSLNTGVYQNLHRLNRNWRFLRRLNFASALFRLAVFALVAHATGLNAITAGAIGLLAYFLVFILQRRRARQVLHHGPQKSLRYFSYFTRSAKRIMPMTILLVATEQSVIFILAANGSTEAIAEVSALSRFGVVFTLLNMLFADMAAPHIARLNASSRAVAIRILVLGLAYLGLAFLILIMLWIAAPWLLLILGDNYNNLIGPFMVIASGQIILNLGYSIGYLVQARGWTRWSWSYGIFALGWVCFSLSYLDLNSTYGAAILMATQTLPNILTQIVRIVAGVHSDRE